ncbi:MAG: hypothetical protein CBB97_07150 [Candidatus Endolissoclinum sp. TMED37]|nr:MAG: hypothetical protein CBB97_07150 [Candidatus Endolissoclinum sp. TMED37]|tara:strand:- start:334 stop:627 length:294 start_codon:yes stop_codon:yes gene_type:complete
MFDLLNFNRQSLQFHTELLEACSWSEEDAERVLVIANDTLQSLRLPDIPCSLDFYLEKSLKPALLSQNILENQVDVIIKFIQHNAKFIQWMMSAREI